MVAIKDMEMPSCCGLCERYLRTCEHDFKNAQIKRHPNCPLVEIEERKVGYWINDAIQGEIEGQIVKAFICSECGAISVFRTTGGKIVNGDLCPNCGAEMRGSENENS